MREARRGKGGNPRRAGGRAPLQGNLPLRESRPGRCGLSSVTASGRPCGPRQDGRAPIRGRCGTVRRGWSAGEDQARPSRRCGGLRSSAGSGNARRCPCCAPTPAPAVAGRRRPASVSYRIRASRQFPLYRLIQTGQAGHELAVLTIRDAGAAGTVELLKVVYQRGGNQRLRLLPAANALPGDPPRRPFQRSLRERDGVAGITMRTVRDVEDTVTFSLVRFEQSPPRCGGLRGATVVRRVGFGVL